VEEYDNPAPPQPGVLSPHRVVLPLKQGAGVANKPLVRTGERVTAGQPLGAIEERALGAIIHAPFAATVAEITDRHIVLTR
jgi:Na+-translocating ferredoxin:NAD+ oxidoreductase RnfC subunit